MQPYMHESHVYKTLFELFSKMEMPLLMQRNSYCSFVRHCVVCVYLVTMAGAKKRATSVRYFVELKCENMSEPSEYVNNETFFAGV